MSRIDDEPLMKNNKGNEGIIIELFETCGNSWNCQILTGKPRKIPIIRIFHSLPSRPGVTPYALSKPAPTSLPFIHTDSTGCYLDFFTAQPTGRSDLLMTWFVIGVRAAPKKVSPPKPKPKTPGYRPRHVHAPQKSSFNRPSCGAKFHAHSRSTL